MAEISASLAVISVILCTIVLGTIIGNIFVIVAILIDKNLQTSANQLVLSLAVADLMVACLVMPLGAYNDLRQGWYLGTLVCEFWTSADVLCCTASILNLLAIALDRYWAVTNVDYIYRRTRRRVNMMILCAWTVGAIVSLAPIFGWKDPDFSKRVMIEHKCLVSQDVAYQIFATISTFYAPLVLLLALYWRIFQVARKRIRRKPTSQAGKLVGAAQIQPDPRVAAKLQTSDSISRLSEANPDQPGAVERRHERPLAATKTAAKGPKVAPVAELDCTQLEWAAPRGPCCARCCACERLSARQAASARAAVSPQINHRAKVTTMVGAYLRSSSPTIGRLPSERDKREKCFQPQVSGSAASQSADKSTSELVEPEQPVRLAKWACGELAACNLAGNIDENLSSRRPPRVVGSNQEASGHRCHLSPIRKPIISSRCDCSWRALSASRALSSDSLTSSCSSTASASGFTRNECDEASSVSSVSCLPCASSSGSSLSVSSPSTSLRMAGKPLSPIKSHPASANVRLLKPPQQHQANLLEQQDPDLQESGNQSREWVELEPEPLNLRGRFRALGRLVSFVQTSRQLASSIDSSASPPSSQAQPTSPGPERLAAGSSPGPWLSPAAAAATDNQQHLALDVDSSPTCLARTEPTTRVRAPVNINGSNNIRIAANNPQQTRANLEIRREKKAAKTLAIITGVFVCCWLPFFLNAIVMPICGLSCTPSDLVLSVLLWLGYLNSLLNPIIYTIFSPDFRRAFRRLLCWPAVLSCLLAGPTAPCVDELAGQAAYKQAC